MFFIGFKFCPLTIKLTVFAGCNINKEMGTVHGTCNQSVAGYRVDVEEGRRANAVRQWSVQGLAEGWNSNQPDTQQTGSTYYW